jgi:hypothetical protein
MSNWKKIPNFPNYECSDEGQFRRNGKLLKTARHQKGYRNIRLYKNAKQYTFRAHRLIYETFVSKIPDGYEINHLNAIKDDNSLSNLECCSHKENMAHAIRLNLKPKKYGKDNKCSVPVIATHIFTGEKIKFDSQREAINAGFNGGNIQFVLKGIRKHHKQYVWHYL